MFNLNEIMVNMYTADKGSTRELILDSAELHTNLLERLCQLGVLLAGPSQALQCLVPQPIHTLAAHTHLFGDGIC